MRPGIVGHLDPPSTRFALGALDALTASLDGALLGVYLYGSGAMGDFVPGSSDVDLMAVARDPLAPGAAARVGAAVSTIPQPPPTRGLDLHLVTVSSAAVATPLPSFELQMLTFADWELVSSPECAVDSRLNLQYALCRRHSLTLAGPPAVKVFAPRPHAWVLAQMAHELRSQRGRLESRVLNACRAWLYHIDRVLSSKRAGAVWARERMADPSLVDAALRCHEHRDGPLPDPVGAEAFIGAVATRLAPGR